MDSVYKLCNRCVMDNETDEYTTFDEKGYCNYCTDALKKMNTEYMPNVEGEKRLNAQLDIIKRDGKGKKYDCLMGLSGGLDSSYLIYLASVKWGLRILALHVDDGYDTEISKRNLVRLSKLPNVTYIVKQPNIAQFNDILRAYMLAGVPNLCAPQDNITLAYLYQCARKYKIRYFLSGGNFALESVLQSSHSHENADVVNIKDIHRHYGKVSIGSMKFISRIGVMLNNRVYGISSLRLLNNIEYNRDRAMNELMENIGFEYYGAKHLENNLTAFLQLYWLYRKFHVDKRKSHLSSLIISEQMSRVKALAELSLPICESDALLEQIIQSVLDNTGISRDELDKLMKMSCREHNEFKISKQQVWINRIKRLGR